jgi:stearoyl-CoA desaturase (delta-9 desaturase)
MLTDASGGHHLSENDRRSPSMSTTATEASAPGSSARPLRRARVLHDDTIRAAQRKHFYLFDLAPLVACVGAVVVLSRTGVTAVDWSIFVVMWILNLIGIEIGFHRLFSHGAFQCTEKVKAALVVLGSMGAQGPVISWASNHRHHHQVSDTPEDSHSPHHGGPGPLGWLNGFWHAHLGWKYDYPYPSPSHYTPALVKDRTVLLTSRRYYWWIALGLVVPAIAGGLATLSFEGALRAGLLGGVVRLVLGQHATWCINSFCHLFGQRPFRTGDKSTNNAWLALPSMGGSWHNNHHAFPTTANNGIEWWQIDLCYGVIRLLERFGLIWDVKVPSAELIESKRARGAQSA